MKKTEKNEIVPLNIVYSYPVHWGEYQIIRDFVQNFYDEVSLENWKEEFKYLYDREKNILRMEIANKGFSYEWLLHIGASTKTEDETVHAGYFGEGFKIASLCAIRDYDWKIAMYSQEWKLEVLTVTKHIDGKNVEMLAYSITETEKLQGSRLEIENFSLDDYNLFLVIQDSFYFPQNKMFGEKIWESEIGAVYERSKYPINSCLPETHKYGKKGAVFCAYQMLGTNPFPLVFCLHDYEKLDRDRRSLHRFEVNNVILEVVTNVTPEAAMVILEKMKVYWNHYPSKKNEIEVEGWSAVVNALIRRIRLSDSTTKMFVEKYPNMFCVSRAYSQSDKNRRRQALSWASREREGYIRVKETFCLLGYRFIEDECEANGGFVESNRLPDEMESKCFDILESLVKDIFGNYFGFNNLWPRVRIITNSGAIYKGMATLFKKRELEVNDVGLKICYEMDYVHMQKRLFQEENFAEALSTYVHELCHVFGGDASGKFSNALTTALQILLEHQRKIEKGQAEWSKVLHKKKVNLSDEYV